MVVCCLGHRCFAYALRNNYAAYYISTANESLINCLFNANSFLLWFAKSFYRDRVHAVINIPPVAKLLIQSQCLNRRDYVFAL